MNSFTNLLKTGGANGNSAKIEQLTESDSSVCTQSMRILEWESANLAETKEKTPEEILRGAGLKIKIMTPTDFGTQIEFSKKYDNVDIEELLTAFTIKIKNKSVFIVL